MSDFQPRLPPVAGAAARPLQPQIAARAPQPDLVPRAQSMPPGMMPAAPLPPVRRSPIIMRTVTLAAFAGVCGFTYFFAHEAYGRGQLAADYFAKDATLTDLQASDDRMGRLLATLVLVQIVAAVALAWWTFRTVRNAQQRFPRDNHRPALAALLWFVPIVNYFTPWSMLKRAATGSGKSVGSMSLWQTFFVLQVLASFMGNRGVEYVGHTQQEIIDQLHQQGIYIYATFGLLSLATIAATVAMIGVDRSTSGRATNG